MIDIRNYKVVYKNKVYQGLQLAGYGFDVDDCCEYGKIREAAELTLILMDLSEGKVVEIWDQAAEFGFVRGS